MLEHKQTESELESLRALEQYQRSLFSEHLPDGMEPKEMKRVKHRMTPLTEYSFLQKRPKTQGFG